MGFFQPTINRLDTDILIIGGGAAGCAAAVEAREHNPQARIIIMEKAQIERSGCLASGINAINAYITEKQTPDSYLEYVKNDSHGLIRDDLVYSIACGVNQATARVESWGLPIMRINGTPLQKGPRSILIKGESIKPILASKVKGSQITVLNRVTATNYIFQRGRVAGAYGFNIHNGQCYAISAKGVIIATGGASGIYRTNNTGEIAHRMWYSPFNTGAGYAMGIRAGAEMTSFEMRFIPTRIKDSATPTGVLAQTFKMPQVNILGEQFLNKRYGFNNKKRATTCERLYCMLREIKEGRGPISFVLDHLTPGQINNLKISLLDMSPAFLLQWTANEIDSYRGGIEISTSGPYIVGGHTQSGYWIDRERRTTLPGLYAAGDVAGGAPKKYVSGCWVEGFIAAKTCLAEIKSRKTRKINEKELKKEAERIYKPLYLYKNRKDGLFPHTMEIKLQKLMDEYAGGISTFYELHERRLQIAQRQLEGLKEDAGQLLARDFHELNLCHEVSERLEVAEVLITHLLARKETRWPGYQTRIDYPEKNDKHWLYFLNSFRDPKSGEIRITKRNYNPNELLKGF
ncbi:MAG: adenylyl-sulfate reductase subunit alpha [Deltaproteobacteria bacterium]|nr:adenylyl-sulfate reductase subunit alpha [Deltaproteobacteria bacterium]